MPNKLVWSDLEIGRVLGTGAAGEVRHATLRRDVGELARGTALAVKFYKAWVLERPGQYERIYRELEVGRRVRHRNVVETHGLIHSAGGTPALVMRYYDGLTLDRHLKESRGLDAEEMFKYLGCIARGLLALHKEGVLHRDVKSLPTL